jgi:hypothetical protein
MRDYSKQPLTVEEKWSRLADLLGGEHVKKIGKSLDNIMDVEQSQSWGTLAYGKAGRKAVDAFDIALRKVENAAKALPKDFREMLYPPAHARAFLLPWQVEFLGDHVSHWRSFCKQIRATPRYKKPSRRDGLFKRQIAKEALALIRKVGQEPTMASDGLFLKVAADLYGNPDADLRLYCRGALKDTEPGSK